MTTGICRECKFYFLDGEVHRAETGSPLNPDDYFSVCRRYPPKRATVSRASHDASRYPVVMAVGWCGEFKKA